MRFFLDVLRSYRSNPFFRHELDRKGRRLWITALSGASLAYLAVFLAVRLYWGARTPHMALGVSAAFQYAPWLFGGGLLLSLCAHWLVPPSLLTLLRPDHDLRTLMLMVEGGHSEEELFRGQVAAGLTPLLLGGAPLLLGLPLLALFGPEHVLPAFLALGGALLWGALASGASLWTGVICQKTNHAAVWAYALTSLALPLLIGGLTLALAHGCSAGQPHREVVFRIAAVLTWSLLVTGCAGIFWDCTVGRLFPEKRKPLWQDLPTPTRPEG